MNETLRLLYDKFYTPLPMVESEQEVETCHRQLIERLDKPERKLVLQIIDAQNLMIEQRSVDSFICGFRLAWELAYELNHFETNRHPSGLRTFYWTKWTPTSLFYIPLDLVRQETALFAYPGTKPYMNQYAV